MMRNGCFFGGDLCGFPVHSYLKVPTRFKNVLLLRDAPVLIMETNKPPSEMLHGHTDVGSELRGQRKVPVLLFTQGVLTCACAALCIYTLYKVHGAEEAWKLDLIHYYYFVIFFVVLMRFPTLAFAFRCVKLKKKRHETPVDRGIYLKMLRLTDTSTYLNFTVTWSNSLKLEHGSEIMVPFSGPYVVYFCALLKGNETKGNLTLSQGSMKIHFELSAQSDNRCVRHQKVISLYEKEKVTFRFIDTYNPYLYLQVLNVGLHYLLGTQEFDTPEYDPDA